MRHETFHDTTNLSKRKPNRLRGTPANKYSYLLSLASVCGFTLACHLFTGAEWVKPFAERFVERTAPTFREEEQKWMMSDLLVNSIIKNKRRREEGVEVEDGSIYSAANF